MTIKIKLLFLIFFTLIVTTITILSVVDRQFVKVIDANQQSLYAERVDTILGILRGYETRLEMTGQRDAYFDGFKNSAIKALRTTYYTQKNTQIYPFIIDRNNQVIMSPDDEDGSALILAASREFFTPGIVSSGFFEIEERWYLFKRFDDWDWVVFFTVPTEIKYAEVRTLQKILVTIMAVITILSMGFMFFAVIRITKPIVTLRKGAQAIAAGNYTSMVDVTAPGEIGQLAKSFITMRDHIMALLTERDNRIAELELTRKELLTREQALQQSSQRLALHIEQTPLGVIEFNPDCTIIQWNRAAENIFGYSSDEVLGKRAIDFIIPEGERPKMEKVWDELFSEKQRSQVINNTITKDARIITCEWYNTVLTDAKGNVIGVASLVLDVSEARRLEEQLRQAHKMEAIGTLAGGIAHDFNNIISVILGYTDMVLDEIPEGSPLVDDLGQIEEAANRAKDLVKQILSFSRKEAMERAPVQIHHLVHEVLKLLRASIPTTITIEHNIDAECGNILANPTQIQQVVINLCTNAAQSMEKDGGCLHIRLTTVQLSSEDLADEPHRFPGIYAKLTIKDSGTGIDPENLSRIFDPYFTTKEVGKGSGMGLAVVTGIVKSHEGLIRIDSELGRGTTVDVYFPTTTQNLKNSDNTAAALPTGHGNVLLVDDEKTIVDVTKKRIERLGYQVTAQTSSEAALELFLSQPDNFDLVITDQTMPGLTGDKLAEKMVEIRPDLPIVLCTGYSAKIDAAKAASKGISAFIMKPVSMQDLASVIKQVMEESKAVTEDLIA